MEFKPWHRMVGKIVIGLFFVGVFLGFKIHKKNNYAAEFKVELVNTCSGHEACTTAVANHFDTCFEKSYDIGGRRRSGGFKQDKFLSCINEHAGKGIFVLEAE